MAKHLKLSRNWRRAHRLSRASISRVLRARYLTLNALGRQPGDSRADADDGSPPQLRSEVAASPGGIDILDIDRRVYRFVVADNW